MPFISDEELNKKLNGTCASLQRENFIIRANREPALERKNYTENEKVLLGALTEFDGPREVAKLTGVSEPTLRKFRDGRDDFSKAADPNNPKVNPELDSKVKNLVQTTKERIQGLAHDKIELALTKLDDEKLEDLKAKDLAIIASSLSKVSSSFDTPNVGTGIAMQFNIFRPRMREEEDYEIIEVHE